MKIVEQRVLRGPNIHSPRPAFQAVIDLEDLDEVSSAALPGFADNLVDLLPTLEDHRCSTGYRGGFVERLREGTYMAHIVEHVLIELQCLAGPEVGFGKARMVAGKPRHYRIVCSYLIEPLVVAALPLALDIVEQLARGVIPDISERLENLRDIALGEELGASTEAIVLAAEQRGIPVLRLAPGTSLYQLGWGARGKRIRATITGETRHLAVELASDKDLTKRLLEDAGLPVPRGEVCSNADQTAAAFTRIGAPAVVKPLDGNQGKGVTVGVDSEPAARLAYERASRWGRRVVVERMIQGDDHRVLVVAGHVVAASHRRPPCVLADGSHTVRQLVEQENGNPRRGRGHCTPLTRIPLDASAAEELAKQGLEFNSVPAEGTVIRLRGNANLSTGGTAHDVTDRLHPATAAACVRAAQAIGLDVAGIDLICADAGQPLRAQGGAIVEVNAAPGIRMHEHPSGGVARRAGAAIVDSLFPEGEDGRIPTIAVTGSNGKTTVTLAIASILRRAGRRTGHTTTEGVWIGEERVAEGDSSGYWSARMVLSSPNVDAAVLETARGGILKRGLAFDWCDVGVVLNVHSDHLGQDGIDDLQDLAWVKGLVARRARKAVVLNADDRRCVEMARGVEKGTHIIYFTMQRANRTVRNHLINGGRAVLLRGTAMVLAEGERRLPLVDTDRLPMTLNGLARHNVANALAVAAAAWAAGIPRQIICDGLSAFRSTAAENPLRLNLYRVNGAMLLVDYAHNAAAYRAMLETGRRLTSGRLVAVIAAPGDRTDEDLQEVGATCSDVGHLVVYEMDDRRGRDTGEAPRIIARGALEAGLPAERIEVIPDLRQALRKALSLCRDGDLLFYGCASHVSDLAEAIPEGPEPLTVFERRRPNLAEYADESGFEGRTPRETPIGWHPSGPDRRQSPQRPHIVSATNL